MEGKRPVRCVENEEIADYLWRKRQEMAEPNGISENLDLTLSNAYRNICNSKTPIKTLKDLSEIKGVGKWILRIMRGLFSKDVSDASPSKNAAKQMGKKGKAPKRYVPQKNSVAYALLITLYRGVTSGNSFMRKQELIDAAEASGLSRTSIAPEKGKGKPGQFGSSPRDWYTGWSCMKTLVSKGLVVKSSCPAKYMLTEEGQEAARECLLRSGLADSAGQLSKGEGSENPSDGHNAPSLDSVRACSADEESSSQSTSFNFRMESVNQIELNDRNLLVGQAVAFNSDSSGRLGCNLSAPLTACTTVDDERRDTTKFTSYGASHGTVSVSGDSALSSFALRSCASFDLSQHNSVEGIIDAPAMPPRRLGEKFEDTYDVILIFDDRENFGPHSRKVVDFIQTQFKVKVEVRRLPIGDGIWIVRHRQSNIEYVLDLIVERKRVDDLCSSIRDNRYRDQKLRLQRCGIQKLIYLVEGDPNSLEAAESIKTACFTTEILEGFDVQRTSGLSDTLKRYGYLTQAISQYCREYFPIDKAKGSRTCPSYNEFVKKCQDLEKMSVSDVFALQLMQIPQVTEDIALAVIELYPTLFPLAQAYSLLEGKLQAQEEMLKNQSRMITSAASKNIFKLVWDT